MTSHCEPIGRGQGHEFVNKLEAAGLTGSLAQEVINSRGNNLAAKVVKLIRRASLVDSVTRAREIMWPNFFGFQEAVKYFGVITQRDEILSLSKIPWSEATLEECKKTHILVAVFPLSILEIRGKVAQDQRLFCNQDWYEKQAFAKERGNAEWKLIRKTPVNDSTGKTWSEQQALLSTNEETPTARVTVYATIGHFLSTAERLFEKTYVRCSDVGSGGSRVYVGDFDFDGLNINVYHSGDNSRYNNLGVSVARLPDIV